MDTTQQNDLSALAPAAGSGIGAQIAAGFLARGDWLALCIDALVAALQANCKVYDKANNCLVTYPDGRTRLEAVHKIWSHLEGEPVKRIIHEVRRGRDAESLQDELTRSPALREAAREMLDAAEKSAGSGAAVEPSAVIDLPPADGAAGSF
jgi:NAD(P)-dependent dehydrogenase (short-subunit alcohol dehydrogenase family)